MTPSSSCHSIWFSADLKSIPYALPIRSTITSSATRTTSYFSTSLSRTSRIALSGRIERAFFNKAILEFHETWKVPIDKIIKNINKLNKDKNLSIDGTKIANSSLFKIDVPLSNLVVGFEPTNTIAQDLYPIVNVEKQSNVFFKWTKGDFFRLPDTTIRAPKTKGRTVSYNVSSDTYYAKNYALVDEMDFEK